MVPATSNSTAQSAALRGGEWLLKAADYHSVVTPEQLTDEHRLVARTTDEFVSKEVLPQLDQLEQKDWALARQLIRRCGELGLLGVDVDEAYGGLDLNKVTSMLVSEKIS